MMGKTDSSGKGIRPASAQDAPDYGSLGTRVASVLEAAERVAEQLQEEASAEAEQVRRLAQQEAAEKVSEATQEASKMLHEAEGLRSEAKNASAIKRERADMYAAKKRQDADNEALEILATAEQVAARQHTEMAEREQALGVRLEYTEKRLGDLVSGLRELAEHLESLLVPPTQGVEMLDDALRESVRAESATQAGP